MTEATQRPWSRDKYGYMIANGENLYVAHGVRVPSGDGHPRNAEALANEELILKAVNNHDALVAALKLTLQYAKENADIREIEVMVEAALEQVKK